MAGPVAIVDRKFCFPQQTQLILREGRGGYSQDSFHVADANGTTYFQLDPKMFSLSQKRTLLDAYGQPCIVLEQKLTSLRGSWVMKNGYTGAKVAEVKPAMLSLSPTVKVYLNDGDKDEDFLIKGNFRAKHFEIVQKAGRQERVIAGVKKESKYSGVTAFMKSQLTTADTYFVTIEPGVDAAFVVALAILCDELFQDQPH